MIRTREGLDSASTPTSKQSSSQTTATWAAALIPIKPTARCSRWGCCSKTVRTHHSFRMAELSLEARARAQTQRFLSWFRRLANRFNHSTKVPHPTWTQWQTLCREVSSMFRTFQEVRVDWSRQTKTSSINSKTSSILTGRSTKVSKIDQWWCPIWWPVNLATWVAFRPSWTLLSDQQTLTNANWLEAKMTILLPRFLRTTTATSTSNETSQWKT